MLLIDVDQMDALEQAGLQRFEHQMVAHSKMFSPRISERLGPEQLRVVVRGAMQKAASYDFTRRGPIRLYVELTFLHGSGFDNDPQYPLLREILGTREDEMERAQKMYAAALEYRAKVAGPGAVTPYQALSELLVFARAPVAVSNDAVANMVFEMSRVFPRKAAYVGEASLRALIYEGIAQCRKHGFTTFREAVVVMALMFTLGHRCTEDPLYPWIATTLQDPQIGDPAAKAQRLETSVQRWLEQRSRETRAPTVP